MASSCSKAERGGDGDAETLSSDAVASHVAHCWKQRKRPYDPFDFNQDKGYMERLTELRFMRPPQGPLPPVLGGASASRDPSPPKVLSSFLIAGGRPLTARDEAIKSKALADDRKAAIKKWVSLVGIDFQSWGIVKQALGSYKPEFATGGLVESVTDALSNKSTATLHQRAGPLLRYCRFWRERGKSGFPVLEAQLYDYIKACADAAPSYPRSLLISVSFANHVLALELVDGCLTSGRVVGLVKLRYTKRSVVKRRPPLTVDQVKALELLVCDDKRASMDRLAAGCFLLMVYGRLRFSDMQRITNMTLDTTVVGAAEVGFLECLAERTKTSLSLERKVRALPIAVPLTCLGPEPWVKVWMDLRDSEGLTAGPTLPSPRIGGGWSKVPTSVSTGASWLRSLVGSGSGDVRVGTHSCKCTVLSWMAKYGSPASDRRLLGYHVPRKDKSLVIYAREALAAPLRVMDEVLRKVASSEFMPDLTASGMLASSVQQFAHQDPDLSESSSEDSQDEEQLDATDEEDAVESVVGRWGPDAEGDPLARHKQSRYLHRVRDESGTHTKCGRALSLRFEVLAQRPSFLHPVCAMCFPNA